MKIGLFDTSELLIDRLHQRLIHKESKQFVNFQKADTEDETLKRFSVALKELEIKVGIWLIEQI
jgi:hypothetical protein